MSRLKAEIARESVVVQIWDETRQLWTDYCRCTLEEARELRTLRGVDGAIVDRWRAREHYGRGKIVAGRQ